jgi:hypothetical protein
MATPTANDVSGNPKGRFRRASTRVFSAFAGALLVFSVSAVASQGLLGSIQGLIDYFVPTVFAVLFGGVANACVADDTKRLYEEFPQTFDPLYAELNTCDAVDETVTAALSKKYRVPFIAAF